MFQEAVECFRQLNYCDVRAGVDELVISVGGVGPAPCVGECVELSLTYLSARLAEENVVIGVGVKRRVEINKIDAGAGKFLPIRKPLQIVAEIEPIHWLIINQNSRFTTKRFSLCTGADAIYRLGTRATTRFPTRNQRILNGVE